MDLTIIIPTRNRPTSLRCVLAYMAKFYPDTPILIADGSERGFQRKNRKIVSEINDLKRIRYLAYPTGMPLTNRLEHAINEAGSEFVFVSADDDFPIMETLRRATQYLEGNPSYVACGGRSIQISLSADGRTSARPLEMRTIAGSSMVQRCRAYARSAFPTYYCVVRKAHALSRLTSMRDKWVTGYSDFMIALHDLCQGELKVLNQLAFIRTANPRHSYIRSTDRLIFLKDAARLLRFQAYLEKELISSGELEEKTATRASEDLLLDRVRYHLRIKEDDRDDTAGRGIAAENFAKLEYVGKDIDMRFAAHAETVEGLLREIAQSTDNASDPRFQSLNRKSWAWRLTFPVKRLVWSVNWILVRSLRRIGHRGRNKP